MDPLKALLWLKWRLLGASYRRNRARLIFLIVMVVLFLAPLSLGLSGGLLWGFLGGSRRIAFELLNVLLAGLWLVWLLAPVFGLALGESADISKQLIFPIAPLRLFLGAMLGSFLDPPSFFLAPLMVAVVIGWAKSLYMPAVTIVVLAVFLIHTFALAQTILLLLLGLVRSRRAQDIATVVGPLVFIGLYVGIQVGARQAHLAGVRFSQLEPSRYLIYTPPGIAARSIGDAAAGNVGGALASGALLLVLAGAAVLLGAHVMHRVYAGEIVDAPRRRARERDAESRRPRRSRLTFVPPAVEAMLLKEMRYLWRDPQMKSMLLALLWPAIWLVVFARTSFGTGPWFPASVGLVCLLAGSGFAMNTFGFDREGLKLLFLFPAQRGVILLGKNALAFVITAGAATIGALIAAAWKGQLPRLPVLLPFLWSFVVLLVVVGNYISVYLPTRVPRRGENPFAQGMEKGCATSLLRSLILPATMLLGLPLAGGYLGPELLQRPVLYALSIPAALAYAGAVYWLALPHIADALLQRETNIIEICAATEEV